jgi:hypothetical protein
MKRWVAGAVAVLAAVGGLAASGSARASSDAWYEVYQANTRGSFMSVAAISKTNMWVVGEAWNKKGAFVYRPLIRHYDGGSWKTVTIPGSPRFESVGVLASAANNVWVFGETASELDNTVMYRYDGSHWRKVPLLADSVLLGPAVVLSPRNVWAVGSCGDIFVRGCALSDSVFHWNGSRWQGYGFDHGDVVAWSVSASAANNVWVAGNTQKGVQRAVAYRWNGTSWHNADMPRVRVDNSAAETVTAFSRSNVWVGWDFSDAAHWNGRRWQTLTAPAEFGPDSSNIVPDGEGGYWFGATAILTGSTWTSVPSPDITGAFGSVARIPGTESFQLPGYVENSSFTMSTPTLFRFDL